MVLKISVLTLVVVNLLLNYVRIEATDAKKTVGVFGKGIMVSVFTPFENSTTSDCEINKINPHKVKDYAEMLAENGVNGVLVNGMAGEGGSLTLSESKVLLLAWVKEAKQLGLEVFVQVGLMTTPGVFEMAAYAEQIGVNAIVVLPSLFYKAKTVQKAVSDVKLITNCAKNTPIFFHDTEMSGVNLNMHELIPLMTVQISKFQGIICELETALEVTSALSVKKNQYLIINKHISTQATFALDFKISISAAFNIAPYLAVGIQKAENKSTAAALQKKLNKIIVSIANPRKYIAALKAAFTIIYGIQLGGPRPPIDATTYEERRHITTQLKKQGIVLKSPVV